MSQPCDPSPSRPTAAPLPPRRVPPPCWTHDETVALIEAYHEKWYALRRGNLKASHWQDVADAVARRCRLATPSKTSVQCRHKIEKLRKRYRTEKQRALAMPPGRFVSSWVFFRKMDALEKGPSNVDSDENGEDENDENEEEDDDDECDEDDDENEKNNVRSRNLHLHHVMSNGGGGFRFRIPSGQRSAPSVGSAKLKSFVRVDEKNPNSSPNPNPNFSSGSRVLNSGAWSRSGGSKREMDPVAEMVSSIRMLGEGFVKMEQMKIEMAREMEQMRMEMEMKRTEMILESQHRIVEAFAQGFSVKKKAKRMPSPDS